MELVALSLARPGAIDYGSGGVCNATLIAGELFATMAGVKLILVPFRGVGPSITALLAGEVQVLYASSVAVQPYVGSGRRRVLAATGEKRIAQMPEVPTVKEAGVPGYVEGNWQAVLVPAKTPRALVNRLNQELVRVLSAPDTRERFAAMGADAAHSTPEEFRAFIASEEKKWAKVARETGIRVDLER